jgi:MFS family permease
VRCVALLAQVTHGYLTSDMHSSDELHSGTYDCGEGGTADRDEIKEREFQESISVGSNRSGTGSCCSISVKKLDIPTLAVLCAVSIVQGLDSQLLPSSFGALERTCGYEPAWLGSLVMGQSLFSALAGPIWASLVDQGTFSRKQLLFAGCMGWGIITLCIPLLISYTSTLSPEPGGRSRWFFFILCCSNGIALASVGPTLQSIIADAAGAEARGSAFGIIQFSSNLGQCLSAIVTTTLGGMTFEVLSMVVAGWEVAFYAIGTLALLVAAVTWVRLGGNNAGSVGNQRTAAGTCYLLQQEMTLMASYFRIPSFRVIVLQGFFGCIPWASLSFLTLYLEYSGMSTSQAGALVTVQLFAGGVGGMIGGHVGDRLYKWSVFHGRPLTAQISVISGTLLYASVLLGPVPKGGGEDAFWVLAALFALFGATATWAGVGCNLPILLELVDGHSHARILGLLNCLNGIVAAFFGAPIVGFVAENVFGYKQNLQSIAELSADDRRHNMQALERAIVCSAIPNWALCALVYSFLHVTLRRDARRPSSDLLKKDETQDHHGSSGRELRAIIKPVGTRR